MIRIAIADDHTILRDGIIAMLTPEEGFEVVADASNGRELISRIKSLKAPPDICLLDVNMPVMDGYDTIVALKASYPEMKFLILSQFENKFIIIKMIQQGAAGYLLKDVNAFELQGALRKIMNGTYYNDIVTGNLINHAREGKGLSRLSLTDREREFLKYCCSELSYKEIADKMDIANRTVAFYRQTLFAKLETKSRTGLALYALRLGLVSLDQKDKKTGEGE